MRLECREGGSHSEVISGRGKSICQESEVGVCLVCWRSKEASGTGGPCEEGAGSDRERA